MVVFQYVVWMRIFLSLSLSLSLSHLSPDFRWQEETMGEARQVETEAATYLDQVSRYFISRAKLISKVAKYPHIVSMAPLYSLAITHT